MKLILEVVIEIEAKIDLMLNFDFKKIKHLKKSVWLFILWTRSMYERVLFLEESDERLLKFAKV